MQQGPEAEVFLEVNGLMDLFSNEKRGWGDGARHFCYDMQVTLLSCFIRIMRLSVTRLPLPFPFQLIFIIQILKPPNFFKIQILCLKL